jgi:hypothetical protein
MPIFESIFPAVFIVFEDWINYKVICLAIVLECVARKADSHNIPDHDNLSQPSISTSLAKVFKSLKFQSRQTEQAFGLLHLFKKLFWTWERSSKELLKEKSSFVFLLNTWLEQQACLSKVNKIIYTSEDILSRALRNTHSSAKLRPGQAQRFALCLPVWVNYEVVCE